MEGLYRELKAKEDAPDNRKDGMASAYEHLVGVLKSQGVAYDKFVLSL